MSDSHSEHSEITQATARRRPRYWRFMGIGAAIGVISAAALTTAGVGADGYSRSQIFGLLVLWLLPAGIALFGMLAVVLDRVLRRSERVVQVERTHTVVLEDQQPPEPQMVNTPEESPLPDDAQGPERRAE